MGIFSKLFGRSNDKKETKSINKVSTQSDTLSIRPQTAESVHSQNAISLSLDLSAHPDLHNLLWWIDGPQKNYSPTNSIERVIVNDIVIEISMTGLQEPSLLSVDAPVKIDVNPSNVDRLHYYPDYSRLSPEQRGVYWKFLHSPYTGSFDIGYVFILYYGLERHLLKGNYEKAFHVILKLRDVYSNGSFQGYSACAIIVACLIHKRIDLLSEFFASIDKDYELKFSANLYFLGKYGLGIPLYAKDIMRMAKDFEFTNLNYIKKYPDMFEQVLREQMQNRYGLAQFDMSDLVSASELKNAYKVNVPAFANVSIESKTIPVPQIIDIFKFKKAVNALLEATHDTVKANVALQRKEGSLPKAKVMTDSTQKKILNFDKDTEATLLGQYHSVESDPVARHYAMISLQDFYYKYRNLDDKYLAACIQFCEEDLSNLDQFTTAWRTHNDSASVCIPAFKRLAIIYEKDKAYTKAIAICDQAISYYHDNGLFDLENEFGERKKKLLVLGQKKSIIVS